MTGRENELAVEGWNYLDGLLDKVQAILRELRELKDWMMQVFGDVRDVRDVRQNTCVLTTTVSYWGGIRDIMRLWPWGGASSAGAKSGAGIGVRNGRQESAPSG